VRYSAHVLLDLDPSVFREKFNRLPFMFPQSAADHPLLKIPSLIELARRLPKQQIVTNSGSVPVGADIDRPVFTGLTGEQALERIEEAGTWVLLYGVNSDPVYRDLVDALLDEVQVLSEPLEPGMCDRKAYIFVASPGSVTPYHMDRDINCLLQFRGTKMVYIWDPCDRSVLPETGLELLFGKPSQPRPHYDESFQSRAYEFQLAPGFAVHHPFTAPHWVKNGPDVSVSMSITFRTRNIHRKMRVYTTNYHLRRLGWKPSPPGVSRLHDDVKSNVYGAYANVRALLQRNRSSSLY
jgi:hypothetical protein